jgi:hypothetical protein
VAYYLVLQRDPGSSSHPGELTKFARILVTGSTPPNATFNVLLSGANPTASYRIRACNAGSGVDPDPTDEDNPGGVKDQNWCRDSTEEFMTDGTPVVSIDFSAGPAPVDAADGSAAGVAGTPGVLPSAFSITAERVESVVSFGEKNLRLVWDRHAPVSACGSNPVAYCNVAYYLVLKRDPFDFSNPDELTKFAYIRMTAGTPSNARFAVQLSTENDSFSYRIRACNGGSGQPGVGGTADQSWCRDSNQEFNADGTPRP